MSKSTTSRLRRQTKAEERDWLADKADPYVAGETAVLLDTTTRKPFAPTFVRIVSHEPAQPLVVNLCGVPLSVTPFDGWYGEVVTDGFRHYVLVPRAWLAAMRKAGVVR